MGKTRSRANGEGTIYQNANGTWTAQISTLSGRRSKTLSTQRKSREWLTQMRRDNDTGEYIEKSDITMKAWWDKWITVYKERSVSDGSLVTYKQTYNRIKKINPSFFNKSLQSLSNADIQEIINLLHDAGSSNRTCELSLVHVRNCLKRAAIDKMIRHNPALNIHLPSDHDLEDEPERELSESDKRILLETIKKPISNKNDLYKHNAFDVILFLMRTGCRCGEALALTWKDVDFAKKEVMINKSIDVKKNIVKTKTNESGTVPLTPDVIDMLRRRQFLQNDFVFASRNNTPVMYRTVARAMKSILPHHSVHDLRHTFVSDCARAGIHPKVVQAILRHKSMAMIMRVYTHINSEDKTEAIAKLYGYCKSTANAEENSETVEQTKTP